jgi:phospholipid transport system substrate-binding protein
MTRRRANKIFVGTALASQLCASFLWARPLLADELSQEATSVVKSLVARVWAIRGQPSNPKARERELALAIETSTNIDLLSRLSLGRYWRSLSETERDAYQSLFAKSVIGSLATRLENAVRELDGPLDRHFVITNSRPTGKKDIVVRSKVVASEGQPLSVDWRLREAEGGPAIIDLVVEGVSLLVSQRAEFAAVIERSGMDGLIERLRRNVGNDES